MVSHDELEAIHQASLAVLRDTGMDFLHPTARRMWADAGASVDGARVRLDPDHVAELVASAPSEFVLHAPDPARHLPLGRAQRGLLGGGQPAQRGRPGRRAAQRQPRGLPPSGDAHRGAQLGVAGGRLSGGAGGRAPVGPPPGRHPRSADAVRARPSTATRWAPSANRDCLEMVRIVRSVSDERLEAEPSIFTRGELQLAAAPGHADAGGDPPVLGPQPGGGGHAVHAGRGDGAGDSGRGGCVQQNAEALAGIAFLPASAARLAGDVRRVHIQRRHAVRVLPPSALPNT